MPANAEVVILSACRTPSGAFLGSLSGFTAPQLGAIVIKEAIRRARVDKGKIDEVLMGNVVSAGIGQAPARQAAIFAGVPASVPCTTINKVCGSGLKTVMIACQAIKAGDADCIVAGGMESMSNCPYILQGARGGFKFGDRKILDAMILDGLWDSFNNRHMGNNAELTAEKSKLSREELDRYSMETQQKAVAAIDAGKFKAEIVPVDLPQRKGEPMVFDTDETPRRGTTVEKLAKLKPAFQKDGKVTAGNSPGLNDGASAVVVSSRKFADENNLKPMARVTAYAASGTEPELLFYAPVYAVRKLCEKLSLDVNDFDLIEANEAFAAQALADGKELGWDWKKVNVNGGAIALGHPIGASAVVVSSRKFADENNLRPMARVTAYAASGTEPELLFYAPVYAVRKLCEKLSLDVNDFDLIEANEAFAAQALADGKELGWDWKKVNVNGGAIALGHPIGASGARVLTTLLYALKDRGGRTGLATLCLGGGNAVALSVEML